jgi:hypothetical protein
MKPTAYQNWLNKVSAGDSDVIEHLIKSDLISGNDAAFELMEESGQFILNKDSVKNTAKYLIEKINKYEHSI